MIHVTGNTAVNIPPCAGILVQCNATTASQTYTILENDGTSTVVTSPLVGQQFLYYGIKSSLAIPATFTASQVGDCSINILSRTLS